LGTHPQNGRHRRGHLDFLTAHAYPGIGGAMTWSINWDKPSGYKFANTVTGHFSKLH
jgi:chitinase